MSGRAITLVQSHLHHPTRPTTPSTPHLTSSWEDTPPANDAHVLVGLATMAPSYDLQDIYTLPAVEGEVEEDGEGAGRVQ